jgi:hypothetical protein
MGGAAQDDEWKQSWAAWAIRVSMIDASVHMLGVVVKAGAAGSGGSRVRSASTRPRRDATERTFAALDVGRGLRAASRMCGRWQS